MVEETDRIGGSQVAIRFAFMQLLLVELGQVEDDPLRVGGIRQHLHFDVELSAGGVAGLDVQDTQLIVERFLVVERIQNFDGGHDTCRRKSEHRVEQVDQQVGVRFGAEQTPFS